MNKKNYIIKYLPTFQDELYEIIYYIKNDLKNKYAANKLLYDVENVIKIRSNNPEDFEIYINNKKSKYNWYRIYIRNYIIFYIVQNNFMEIAHIIYNKRDITNIKF